MKIEFTTYKDASENYPASEFGGMGGFFDKGMRWQDYLSIWIPEVHPQLEALRSAIIAAEIKCTGEERQHSDMHTAPIFPDGTAATYSYRAWGDLMAAIWSTEDDEDYTYMTFYC